MSKMFDLSDAEPWAYMYLVPSLAIFVIVALTLMAITSPIWLTWGAIAKALDTARSRKILYLKEQNKILESKLAALKEANHD